MKNISCRRLRASALFTVLVGSFLLAALGGCSGQQATLSPRVTVDKESLGHEVAIAVTARDARSEPVVGLCNPGSSLSGKLTMACDPAPAIGSAVRVALREKGFTPTAKSDTVVRSLQVDLTELTYAPQQEGARLVARAKVVLAVTAENNGQPMKRRYAAETVWKLSGDNIEPDFDKLLSQVVAKALRQMASDYELIHFLEKTVLRTHDIK